jgi:hypothetical protein
MGKDLNDEVEYLAEYEDKKIGKSECKDDLDCSKCPGYKNCPKRV